MNDLFISIEYNEREFEGIDKFRNTLNKNYNYQLRPIWIPSAAEGAELWITVFINSEIGEFIKNIIIGGVIWDLIKVGGKKYIFTPLFKALEKLNENNQKSFGGLRVMKMKLQFDDCEIIVAGLNKNFISNTSIIFNEVAKKKPEFERIIGQEVIKIEMPIVFLEHYENDYEKFMIDDFNEECSNESYKNLWRVTFSTDYPILIYSFRLKKLFEPKELSEILKTPANK